MEKFGVLMMYILQFFQREYDIYEYQISMWQIFMFTIVGGIVFAFIGGFFSE